MPIQSINRAELLALLECAKRKRTRDWLMILLAFNHGLRASEVVALTPVNFSSTHITVQRLKGSLRTTQALREDANPLLDERKALFEYLRKKPRNQRLFNVSRVRFWQLMQEHAKAADIEEHKRHPHVLKHSIAMQTIESAGIENVRQHLGHKSIGSTGAYLRVTDEAAGAAIKKALAV